MLPVLPLQAGAAVSRRRGLSRGFGLVPASRPQGSPIGPHHLCAFKLPSVVRQSKREACPRAASIAPIPQGARQHAENPTRRHSCLQLDDHLDIIRTADEGVGPARQRDPLGEQARQPSIVGLRESGCRLPVVALGRIDGAEDHLVAQHQITVELRQRGLGLRSGSRDAAECDHCVGVSVLQAVEDELTDAGALKDDVGLQSSGGNPAAVVARTDIANQFGLDPVDRQVQDMHVEPPLDAEQRRFDYDQTQEVGVAGDEQVVADAVHRWAAAGADSVILQPTADEPDPEGFVRFIAEAVRPLVR